MRKRLYLSCVVVPILVAHVCVAFGQDVPAVIDSRSDLPMTQRIRKALDSPLPAPGIDFPDTPLTDAASFLKDLLHVEIVLDNKALEEAGIQRDTPIKLEAHEMTLRSALKLLSRSYDLRFENRNEALIITTPDRAD